MGWARATRDLSEASDVELAALHEAAKLLMAHQRRISPRVMTELCLIREETDAELRKRAQPQQASSRYAETSSKGRPG